MVSSFCGVRNSISLATLSAIFVLKLVTFSKSYARKQ